MAKKEDSSNVWIVTFADLVTLLFIFFVLLTMLSAKPKNCGGISKYMENHRNLFLNYELRATKLECIISLPQDYLFRSGRAEIRESTLRDLTPFFELIKSLPEHQGDLVIVEGHTDNVPIRTRRYPSNWELSSSRSLNMARFLVDRLGYDEKTVSINAYADTRPKIPYLDEFGLPLKGKSLREARRVNRRIEVILVDQPKSRNLAKILFDGRLL